MNLLLFVSISFVQFIDKKTRFNVFINFYLTLKILIFYLSGKFESTVNMRRETVFVNY